MSSVASPTALEVKVCIVGDTGTVLLCIHHFKV